MKTTLALAWKLSLVLSTVSLLTAKAEESKTPASPAPTEQKQTPQPKLSAWTKEIVKLAEARIDEEVMLSFVDNSGTFNLGAAQIIHLKDMGVPPIVVNAMLRHDQEIIAGLRMMTISSDPGYESLLELKVVATNSPAAEPKQVAAPTPAPALVPQAETIAAQPPVEVQTGPFPLPEEFIPPWPEEEPRVKRPLYPTRLSPRGTKVTYPVRSPHAEQLLPPILVVKAVIRTPNLFIIEGFPRE